LIAVLFTHFRWHFWCTELAPSGKQSASVLFDTLRLQDGPEQTNEPNFPKKQFASVRDQKRIAGSARDFKSPETSIKKCITGNHDWKPLMSGHNTV
jgi:hypothetical protein